jgi:hypothetical protein
MDDEFWTKIRRRDYDGALYERGYFVSPAPPRFTEPERDRPPSPRTKALMQRYHIHRLIDRGLAHFPSRLAAAEWRQVQAELQMFDPSLRGLILHINELIAATRRVALENGDSYGVWNLMEAAAFHTWANELVEALEQYRREV